MMRNDDHAGREARLALVRRSLERLEQEMAGLARVEGLEVPAKAIEAVRLATNLLETSIREQEAGTEAVRDRTGSRVMTPAMAFCLAC